MLSESQKIDLITQISLDINEVKDLDVVLERILTQVRRFFNADAGSIYLKEGDMLRFTYTQNETLRARQGPDRKLIYSTFSLPINNQSIAGFVAHNREVVNLPDVYRLEGSEPYTFDSDFDEISRYRTRSVLAVPMTNQRGEVLGVMQLINAQDDQGRIIPFSRSDETVIRHFATTAALAVERAQMTRNIILRMISMAELRDPKETGAHVNRVGSYSSSSTRSGRGRKGSPVRRWTGRRTCYAWRPCCTTWARWLSATSS
ncbi:MAG: GAF domain-containing protein [Deltaproteobacteria bacterium]|nr:GAF domain-containing protein [Deltaproteobacteria bacterium]